MRTRCLVVLASLVVSVRAAAQPAAPTTPPPPPPVLEAPPVPRVDDPKLDPLPQAANVIGTWDEAAAMARARSTELRTARADIERARGASRQALAGALPSASGRASVTRTLWEAPERLVQSPIDPTGDRVPLDPWTWQASVTVTQPLIAPRAWYAIGTARRAARNATLSAEDQERLVAAGVAEAIVGLLAAERLAELNRTGLRSALETLELTRIRERLGAANALDIVRVRQDAAVARAAVVSGDEAVRQARETLGVALGHGEAWGVSAAFDLARLETGLRGACAPVVDLAERADLAAARGALEVAEREVTEVKLQFVPTVDLETTLSAVRTRVSEGAEAEWSVQAVLSVPIWDGGARYGALRIADADRIEAEQRLESVRRAASVETDRALRGVGVAVESRNVAAEARDLAVETDRLARLNFSAGRGTSLDVVQAAQQRRQAELQFALREFDVVGARVAALLTRAKCASGSKEAQE